MSFSTEGEVFVLVFSEHEVVVSVHAFTVGNDVSWCCCGAHGVFEHCEHVVPSVEREHGTFLGQHLIVAVVLGVLVGVAIAQIAVVSCKGYASVGIETSEEVESLKTVVVGSCHEILDDPSVVSLSALLHQTVLQLLVEVCYA